MNQILNILLLQAEGAAEGPLGGLLGGQAGTIILFGGMFLVFYLFMIRPQQQKQKEERLFRESIKKGDKVMTIGGIHGIVNTVDADSILVDIDNKGTKIRFEKGAIKPIGQEEKK